MADAAEHSPWLWTAGQRRAILILLMIPVHTMIPLHQALMMAWIRFKKKNDIPGFRREQG